MEGEEEFKTKRKKGRKRKKQDDLAVARKQNMKDSPAAIVIRPAVRQKKQKLENKCTHAPWWTNKNAQIAKYALSIPSSSSPDYTTSTRKVAWLDVDE
jgi:hypothetical protein